MAPRHGRLAGAILSSVRRLNGTCRTRGLRRSQDVCFPVAGSSGYMSYEESLVNRNGGGFYEESENISSVNGPSPSILPRGQESMVTKGFLSRSWMVPERWQAAYSNMSRVNNLETRWFSVEVKTEPPKDTDSKEDGSSASGNGNEFSEYNGRHDREASAMDPFRSPLPSEASVVSSGISEAQRGQEGARSEKEGGNRRLAREVMRQGSANENKGEKKKGKKKNDSIEYKSYAVHQMDAPKLWAEMDERIQNRQHHSITTREKERLLEIFRHFRERGWAADQALALYINSKFFPTAASRFKKFVFRAVTPELKESLLSFRKIGAAEEYLFPLFAEFCFNEFPAEIKAYKELVTSADMTLPHTWYPFARAMKRKVIYHRGPTNSGKTYTALQRLRQGRSGVYCGPLRLLAMEVYDTLNTEGVYCNLITGQEKKIMPFADHTACTIEMANLMQSYEVAVIDEIQMITDEYRGWAWTRAFLGLQAEEVHVCGDSSALPLLQTLCASTGDDFQDFEYERFKPLKVDPRSLEGDFRNVQAGDCIVAFSRREIFEIKRQVETMSRHRCCVVYGALPPETRRQQAKLFNEPSSGYEVLVASDAVGMGLNLNIRRVVFYALQKFNGEEKALIPAPMVKQIAGRAGRRGSLYPEGIATSFYSQDVVHLINGLQQPVEPLQAAGLFPFFEQVELFASQLPDVSFAQLLDRFVETSRVDGAYFLCKTDNLRRLANMLEKVPGLSLEDRFKFCFAPANSRDPEAMAALLRFAQAYAAREAAQLSMASPTGPAADDLGLMNLETKHQVASMYMWLSQHFPEGAFPQGAMAELLASEIAELLQASLAKPSRRSRLKPPTETGPRWRQGDSAPSESFRNGLEQHVDSRKAYDGLPLVRRRLEAGPSVTSMTGRDYSSSSRSVSDGNQTACENDALLLREHCGGNGEGGSQEMEKENIPLTVSNNAILSSV